MTDTLNYRNQLFLLMLTLTLVVLSAHAARVAEHSGKGLRSLPSSVPASEGQAAGQGPRTLRTYYATIRYPEDALLTEFAAAISRSGPVLGDDVAKARKLSAEEVDKIVFRVKTLLDMYPVNFTFNVRLHTGYDSLREAYRETGGFGRSPIAFFTNSTNTIHLTVDDLNAGILAHEIAHAVINAYFPTPPPAKMQEILSQYVDKHLWDE